MTTSSKEILIRLGSGEPIASICASAGWSRQEFDTWWCEECRQHVPTTTGTVRLRGPGGRVRISRDRWGIPHIVADSDADLFFGFGYATAQDRLFQLDHLRRKARGRLAEILGPDGLDSDVLSRTLGLAQIAEAEWHSLAAETRDLLTAYSAGINALIDASGDRLPIEFGLLDYRPEPWSPVDSLALIGEFRWYLTGRFPVIVIPELVKCALGDGPLYRAFLQAETDGESIMPPGSYPRTPHERGWSGETISDPGEGQGSNNWVLAGTRTVTGLPLVASDPHLPFAAVSMLHEIHLHGGSFHVAGSAYAGMPAIMIGCNARVAWGITNNLSSVRDLYQERTAPEHPGCFLHDGRWERVREREEMIKVRGKPAVARTICSSRNGPIVDHVLPTPARGTGPVSLRWLGVEPCGWLTALLGMNRARTADELRQATRPWRVPTFNLVYADVDGHIGHHCAGCIPIRHVAERGYRPGWHPEHQWDGVIPFEAMPHQADPKRGFAVTANNRLAPDDYPYPLSGTWSSGHRARRIRQCLEARPQWSADECRQLHYDISSGRAANCLRNLTTLLAADGDSRVQQAVKELQSWNGRMEATSTAAALFNVFFVHWCRTVTAERLPASDADFVAAAANGLATTLLAGDDVGWFTKRDLRDALRLAFVAALDELTAKFGPDMKEWSWGRRHTLLQKHFLSGRGDLGQLLDRSGLPIYGDSTTVCNMTPDAAYAAYLGPSYRMVVDLADSRQGLRAVSVPGQSGNPGSPHYDDQITPWFEGGYHALSLDGGEAEPGQDVLLLEPV